MDRADLEGRRSIWSILRYEIYESGLSVQKDPEMYKEVHYVGRRVPSLIDERWA